MSTAEHPPPPDPAETYPRQKARTRAFTLGAPRSVRVSDDGQRVVFLRSPAGSDPNTCLWVYDRGGTERLIADPADLLAGAGADLAPEERARRERMRETAGGIVGYATNRAGTLAAFALEGRLFVADLVNGGARELTVPGPVLDPRPDPTGTRVAFVADRALRVVDLTSGAVTTLTAESSGTVTWGLADFVAAEEMHRFEGFWWAPDGSALLACRVDDAPVTQWWLADPAHPERAPQPVRYPAAGTANADVTVHVVDLSGRTTEVQWPRTDLPYVASAYWDEHGPLLAVQSRDQRRLQIRTVDPATGRTESAYEETDPAWTDLIPGLPRRLADSRLVWTGHRDDRRALLVDGVPVSPPDIDVHAVVQVGPDAVVFTGSTEPTEVHVWRWQREECTALTTASGVHSAAVGGSTVVLASTTMDHDGTRFDVGGHVLDSAAAAPVLTPRPRLLRLGGRELRAGLVLPRDHQPGHRLPVLMDPYAGPGSQRVMTARGLWRDSQWLADQGFAVLVADGRGTPGRGRSWARAIEGDLAGPVLEDQVDALHAAAAAEPDLDLSRVAIRGWSFGGYLAALAVLRRPDVFHAAVAGAPVTEWRLYDTHYTERYLGTDPDGADRESYDRSSLLGDADKLERPLLLIHGLADDNVVAAHTLRLSQRLMETGRPHTVLPLTGVTHMTPQEAVAENLLLLQVEFLRGALERM